MHSTKRGLKLNSQEKSLNEERGVSRYAELLKDGENLKNLPLKRRERNRTTKSRFRR